MRDSLHEKQVFSQFGHNIWNKIQDRIHDYIEDNIEKDIQAQSVKNVIYPEIESRVRDPTIEAWVLIDSPS